MLDSHCGGLGIKGKTSNAWEVEGGMGNGEGTEEELPHFTLVCLFSWRGGGQERSEQFSHLSPRDTKLQRASVS